VTARFNIRSEWSNPKASSNLAQELGLDWSEESIRGEVNLKLCDIVHTRVHCGELTLGLMHVTDLLLSRIPKHLQPKVALYDVRTHHMQPGDIPSYNTGWHVDSERSFKHQVDHINTIHFLFLSGPPLTEFFLQQDMEQLLDPELYGVDTFKAPAGKIISYNSTELHRARMYRGDKPAWRYFFRATWFPKMPERDDVFANEVYAGPTVYEKQR
jgi:hypothetical protein